MSGISIRAILLATLAVFGIDFVSSTILAGIFSPGLTSMTPDEMRAAIAELNRNGAYLLSALTLGTASTVVGGYLAARLASAVPYFNALAFGLLGMIIGIVMTEGLPLWIRVLGLSLTVPAALLGAHIRKLGTG